METQKDVPKTVAPTMNLELAIPISYARLLKSKYNCINAPVTFILGDGERSILCLTGKGSLLCMLQTSQLCLSAETHVLILCVSFFRQNVLKMHSSLVLPSSV